MNELKLLRMIFDAVPAMIWLKDAENNILRANRMAAESIGRPVTDVEGRSTYELYPELADKYHADDLEVIRSGRPTMNIIENYDVPGEKPWVKTNKIPYQDAVGNAGVLVFAIDISDLKKTEKELEASRQGLRDLAAHLQSVREEERERIAREIHDELSQKLTVLKLDFYRKLEKHSPESADAFSHQIDRLLQLVRRISSSLRPVVLDDLGLEAAIEWLCEEFREKAGVSCSFLWKAPNLVLSKDKATGVFRICQELLTNAVRHSDAKHIEVSVREREGRFVMEVRDDGKGIPEEKIRSARSFGLVGMRERAISMGGSVQITSTRGKGTHAEVRIPLG